MSTPRTLFLSHGAPTLALDHSPTVAFLRDLGQRVTKPKAVVIVSAHHTTAAPVLGAHPAPPTVHDFGGFPEPLYRLRYPSAGAVDLAERTAATLRDAGFDAAIDPRHGIDHGVWVPLLHLFPAADVPVVPLSVSPRQDAAWHLALGRALAPLLSDEVLLIGSGGFVHNLGRLAWQTPDARIPSDWARDFADWMTARIQDGESGRAVDWLAQAPQPRLAHPTPEHLLPLFVAWGAAGADADGTLLHQDWELGSLAMHAFGFS